MRDIAEQALEWVRVSEERVASAEARTEAVRVELKQRAIGDAAATSASRDASASIPSAPKGERPKPAWARAGEARDRAE